MIEIVKKSKEKDYLSCLFCTKKDYDIIYEIKSTNPDRRMVIDVCEECFKEIVDKMINIV